VRGYFHAQSYAPAMAVTVAAAPHNGVDLAALGPATGVLTGSLDYVAGAPGAQTAVALRLQATGEVPPGLSVATGNGPYRLEGIPDGTYDVLASFPTDGLVKDPDPGIAGTGTPTVTMMGATVDAGSFKVTAPVDIMGPDAEAVVAGAPTFSWSAYPSAGTYRVVVFDSFGNQIWTQDTSTTSLSYGGAALARGLFYQWRLTAFHNTDLSRPISMSEDLRGVWQVM
jgi:hypothetical protein